MNWATESGLLDEYEGTIENAWFATDVNYQDGDVPLLHFEFTNIKAPEADEAPDSTIEKYSVGSGWEVVDGGKAVEHESGRANKKFNNRSKYGMLIDSVVKNKEGKFDGLLEKLSERGDPKEAAVWEGLRFKVERVEVDYGGDIGTRDFLLPVEYLGEEGGSSKQGSNGKVDSEALRSTLTQLAQSADDYDDFISQALKVDGVTDDDELLAQVTDAGDEGFYAKAAA